MTNQDKTNQLHKQNETFKQQLAENLYNRIDNNVPLTRNQRESVKKIIDNLILNEVHIYDMSQEESKPKKTDK